jgi:PleD family two-component response regulator
MITAVDDVDSIVKCIEMGAEDYLPMNACVEEQGNARCLLLEDNGMKRDLRSRRRERTPVRDPNRVLEAGCDGFDSDPAVSARAHEKLQQCLAEGGV